MSGLLKVVATELANYKLDFVVVEEFKSNKLGTERAVDFSFSFENGNES
jgi:molybdopterin-guanine dinucleotide biosynthesis protein